MGIQKTQQLAELSKLLVEKNWALVTAFRNNELPDEIHTIRAEL
jgi:hypothetical protein